MFLAVEYQFVNRWQPTNDEDLTDLIHGGHKHIRTMKRNEAANSSSEFSWYRNSPIKLSSKQTGKPPSGKGKVKRGTLIEADKDIFDRLLNVASISMFDDDEDHLRKEEDVYTAVTGRNDKNSAVNALIPSLRGTYHCRDDVLKIKHAPKHNRKVSFSESLDSDYSSEYSHINESFAKMKPQHDASKEMITEIISQHLDTIDEFLDDQRTNSGFFGLLDQNTECNANLSDQQKGAYDCNTKLFSYLDGAGDTAHSIKTDFFYASLHNLDASPINVGALLQNMSKDVFPPPVPPLAVSHNPLPIPLLVSKPLVTRMKDMELNKADDEFTMFGMYLKNVNANRAILMKSCSLDKDDPTFTDIYILSVSDIFNTAISTENLEEKVVKKVCEHVSPFALILRIRCIIYIISEFRNHWL